jgi:hypothetical protein
MLKNEIGKKIYVAFNKKINLSQPNKFAMKVMHVIIFNKIFTREIIFRLIIRE